MGFSVQDKVALVTGANRGIGKSIVETLLKHGAKKVYAAVRNPDSAVDLVKASGGKVVAVELDLARPATITAAAKTAKDVQLVVNNAGVLKTAGPLDAGAIDALQFGGWVGGWVSGTVFSDGVAGAGCQEQFFQTAWAGMGWVSGTGGLGVRNSFSWAGCVGWVSGWAGCQEQFFQTGGLGVRNSFSWAGCVGWVSGWAGCQEQFFQTITVPARGLGAWQRLGVRNSFFRR